jgi:BirA family biotin operon repressor/biotin-[acetyl-CoA-carboxylase] ligase
MILSESTLLAMLADGQFHSGQQLANDLGVSRTAIWKHLASIQAKGLEVNAIKGKGYSLSAPVELLDETIIRRFLTPSVQQRLAGLKIFHEIDSTNRYLRDVVAVDSIHAKVILAEYQSEGKGRGNNQWLTGMASGLSLSIGWHFDSAPATLSALSLATGVVLSRSLRQFGNQPIQLKWPNDLVYGAAKLGGILIESRGQLAGPVDVIIGIGINVQLPRKVTDLIEQNVTDLTTVYGTTPSRNGLAGVIINNMFELLENYTIHGFESWIDEWRKLDYGRGKQAIIRLPNQDIPGQIVDIDENGYLLMSVNGKLIKYSSGDLSLRVQN